MSHLPLAQPCWPEKRVSGDLAVALFQHGKLGCAMDEGDSPGPPFVVDILFECVYMETHAADFKALIRKRIQTIC
jgi:hypothetical protein